MPTDNSEHPNTESLPEPETKIISVGLVKKIVAVAILAEVLAVWAIVFRIISLVRRGFESPHFVLIAIAVGVSLIGWGFAKSLAPRLPGISLKRTLKYIVGVLLALYVLYPTYENFRGDDDISLATLGITGTKTIADVKAIAPRVSVLQHGLGTYRMEVTRRDARRLAGKGFRIQLIQNPEQRAKVKKLDKIPAGTPNVIVQQMIRAVSADSLFNTVRRLERFGTRVDGSEQADSAAELLSREFKRYGLEVQSQAFGEPSQAYLDVQVVDDKTLFVSTFAGQLLCSIDGGRTWISRASGMEPLMRFSFANPRVGCALTWTGKVFTTSNGGYSWREQQPDSLRGYSDVRCLDPRVAIVLGSGGRILRTDDGGNRWKRVAIPSNWNLHKIDSPDGKNIWVVGDGGVLLHSTDVGKTWYPVNAGTSGSLRNLQFFDRKQGIVLGDSVRMLVTGDGGRSWKALNNDLRDFYPTEMLFTNILHGWIIDLRYEGLVLETSDGGRHWVEPQSRFRTIRRLSGRNLNTILACGSMGVLDLSKDRGTTWRSISSKLQLVRSTGSRNICATLRGTVQPENEIILVGHYDSAHRNAPGANDNASGTAAVLEAARICSRYRFERTIRFLAAGAEERGLVGSGFYAREAKKSGRKILAVINADMVGYPVLGDARRIAVSTGKEWTTLMDSTLLFNRRYSLGFILDAHTALMGGSDHESFIREGYPAIDLSEGTAMEIWGGFDPFYHRPSDTSDKLDRNLLRNTAQLMIMIAAESARPIDRGGK